MPDTPAAPRALTEYLTGRPRVAAADHSSTSEFGRFEDAWPALAQAVRKMLGAKRVPPSLHDDIVQETGARLWERWREVDTTKPVAGLAVTIALNLARDEARSASSHPVTNEVPDLPAPIDVERSALAALELRRVARALGALPRAHRSALMTTIEPGWSAAERTPAALRVMRFRARRCLETLLDRAGYALAPQIRISDVIRGAINPPAVRDLVEAAASGVAAVAITLITAFPPASAPSSPPARGLEPVARARIDSGHGAVAPGVWPMLAAKDAGGLSAELRVVSGGDLANHGAARREVRRPNALQQPEVTNASSVLRDAAGTLRGVAGLAGAVLDGAPRSVLPPSVADITRESAKGRVAGASSGSDLGELEIVENLLPSL